MEIDANSVINHLLNSLAEKEKQIAILKAQIEKLQEDQKQDN